MSVLKLADLKHCPFCGADAEVNWVLDGVGVENGHGGKAIRVSCSRDGECPSPSWTEVCREHESDYDCLISVTNFWNTRAQEWDRAELVSLKFKMAKLESELRATRIERDRAMKACEDISRQSDP